jgi:hypothetical protein
MRDSRIDSTSDGIMNRLEVTGLALPEATFGSRRLARGRPVGFAGPNVHETFTQRCFSERNIACAPALSNSYLTAARLRCRFRGTITSRSAYVPGRALQHRRSESERKIQ